MIKCNQPKIEKYIVKLNRIKWMTKLSFFVICILGIVLFFSGCTSTNSEPSSINSNSNSISTTCIGNCQIGQSATDGYYNFQKFTLNQVTRLHQPYFDPDPDPGFEWHNWDYLILNVTIESIRPEKSTEVGGIRVKDANGKEITCAYHIPQQLTTIYSGDSISAHQKVMGNIACYLRPDAKIPYNIEYVFQGFSNGEPAKYSISSYSESNYANIEKNPKLGIPSGVKINQ